MIQPFRRVLLSVVLWLTLPLVAGWLVDQWLGSSPLGLAVAGLIGSVVSVVLVCRTARGVFDAYRPAQDDGDAGERQEDDAVKPGSAKI
jgi:F0F1-type ATP synthase assembly protein I